MKTLQIHYFHKENKNTEEIKNHLTSLKHSFSFKISKTVEEFEKNLKRHPFDVILANTPCKTKELRDILDIRQKIRLIIPTIFILPGSDHNKAAKILTYDLTDYIFYDNLSHLPFVIEKALAQRNGNTIQTIHSEWKDIFEAIGHSAVILDPEHNILEANDATVNITGLSKKELIGQKCYKIFHRKNNPADGCPLEKVKINHRFESAQMEVELLNGYYFVSCTPIFDKKNNLVKIIHIATDITERKKAVDALKLSEKRYKVFFENAGTSLCTFNEDGTIIMCNTKFSKLINIPREEIVGKMKWPELLSTEDINIKKNDLHPHDYEVQYTDKSGNKKDIYIQIGTMPGKTERIASLIDVTSLREAEKKITSQLKEKEVLLKEIHHRVKNNLQIISSLLNLQSHKLEDKAFRSVFVDSQSRIRSIAIVHEELYKSKDLTSIDFKQYVVNLMNYLIHTFTSDLDVINTSINTNDIRLSIDNTISCGLIINELLTNSMKYAFPPSFKGQKKISLSISLDNKGIFTLFVKDNGIGIPEKMDIDNAESLGMRLIKILVEDQLNGKISILRDNGTCFKITFPASN